MVYFHVSVSTTFEKGIQGKKDSLLEHGFNQSIMVRRSLQQYCVAVHITVDQKAEAILQPRARQYIICAPFLGCTFPS